MKIALSVMPKTLAANWKRDSDEPTGDVKSQLQGKAKQMEGAVQDVYGQVKETASDAVEAIRESASGAEDSGSSSHVTRR
jgi:hypothetical protein